MIVVLGSIVVRDGYVEEALALSREHVARSRSERGCIAHNVHVDAEQPRRLVFVEQWADREALAAHFKVPDSLKFVKAVRALAEAPPSISIYEAAAVKV